MLAHVHGQLWNGAELARSFGVSESTVRRYLDLLASTFVVRLLPPWHESLAKRQVRSPKAFFTDSGLLHALLGIAGRAELVRHPKLGASWEGFVLLRVTGRLRARPEECSFWATHLGAELDLLVVRGGRRRGYEVKRTSAPAVTPSLRTSLKDLGLESLDVIHAGAQSFPLTREIRAVAAARPLSDLEPLPRG